MSAPLVETERLLLRSLRESDLDAFAAMGADPEVMRFIGTGGILTRAESWRSMAFLLGHWELRGHGMWAIERKADGAFIGRVGFLEPEGWPGFELGWLLGRPYWGTGYAREGALAALRYAHDKLGRERIISLIRPENQRSIRLAASLGARQVGELNLLGGRALVYEFRGAEESRGLRISRWNCAPMTPTQAKRTVELLGEAIRKVNATNAVRVVAVQLSPPAALALHTAEGGSPEEEFAACAVEGVPCELNPRQTDPWVFTAIPAP